MRRNKIVRWFFNCLYHWRLPSFVQYWKTGDVARAKLVTLKDGSYAMLIEGEKYPLYGFPRGPVLFGPLARLKYLVKNLIFNEVWKMLEEGKTNKDICQYVKRSLPIIYKEIEKNKYDMFPIHRMCPAIRELWRAMTVVKVNQTLKEGLCFFFQEDDAYRFRLQWLAQYGNPRSWYRRFYCFFSGRPYSLQKELEVLFNFIGEAEIVSDMRGRMKLIKKVVLFLFEDEEFKAMLEKLAWELDWKKVKLSKSDRYYFMGKYFKVLHSHYDY